MSSPVIVKQFTFFKASFLCALLLVAAGCSHDTEAPVVSSAPPAPPPVQATTDKSIGQVTIYKVGKTGTGSNDDPMSGLVPVTLQIPVDAHSPARDALQYLITDKDSPLPRGTKLLGVSVDNATSTAKVNFSKQILRGVNGETKAQIVVNSILATMGQFSNVKQVQLEVDGKTDCDFGGVISCGDVLPVITQNAAVAQKPEKE